MDVSASLDLGPTAGDRVRVLTLNILGRQSGWEDRRRVLVDGVQRLRPDIVALQETIVTDSYDQAADVLGEEYQIVHSGVRGADGMGISIGSRWPIANSQELDLKLVSPRTREFPCTTLIAEVRAPSPVGTLLLANHFPDYQVSHEHERERQAVIAARALEAAWVTSGGHVVLAGDLDAEPDAASLRFLTGRQSLDGLSVCYRSAWEGAHPGQPAPTFTPSNPLVPEDWPFRQIDHVLIRCGMRGRPTLRIAACEMAFDRTIDGVWASDHFGLVADLVSLRLDGSGQ